MRFYKIWGITILSTLGFISHFAYAKEQKDCVTAEKYLKKYGMVECFKGNPSYAKVTNFDRPNTHVGIIDKSGTVILPVEYYHLDDFSEGLVGAIKDYDGGFGYLNNHNKIVIPFDYSWGKPFKNGVALVNNKNWLLGGIDRHNHAVIPLIYITLYPVLDTGLYVASKNVGIPYELFEGITPENHWRGRTRSKYEFMGVIDKHNKAVVPFDYQYLHEINLYNIPNTVIYTERYIAQKNDKYGVIKENNQTVIPFIYDYLGTITDGYIAKFEGKFGKLDKHGKVVIPFIYQDDNLGQKPVQYIN